MEAEVRALVGFPFLTPQCLEMGVSEEQSYSFQLHESAVTAYLAQSRGPSRIKTTLWAARGEEKKRCDSISGISKLRSLVIESRISSLDRGIRQQ